MLGPAHVPCAYFIYAPLRVQWRLLRHWFNDDLWPRIPAPGLTSGTTLLTGNILRFGFTEPTLPDTQVSALLEFEFTTTGGDLASYFGSKIQMVLDPALTFGASPFAASFTNSANRSSAAADTFSAVPTPGPFIMGLLGLAGIIARRRR